MFGRGGCCIRKGGTCPRGGGLIVRVRGLLAAAIVAASSYFLHAKAPCSEEPHFEQVWFLLHHGSLHPDLLLKALHFTEESLASPERVSSAFASPVFIRSCLLIV